MLGLRSKDIGRTGWIAGVNTCQICLFYRIEKYSDNLLFRKIGIIRNKIKNDGWNIVFKH